MNTRGANATVMPSPVEPARARFGARPRSDRHDANRAAGLFLEARLAAKRTPSASQLACEASLFERIGGLVGVTGTDLNTARGLFNLLGDPGRRTVLERLARQPDRPGRSLPDVTGMNNPDLYHRLRSLTKCGFVTKNRHHVYSVDPRALACASRYADLLTLAASLTVREPPR